MVTSIVLAHRHFGLPNIHATIGQFAICFVSVSVLIQFMGHSEQPAAIFLRSTPMRYLGQISYGIYIYHFPFLRTFSQLVEGGWLPKEEALRFPFVLCCTLIVATLSWFLLERPCCNLKRYFQPKRRIDTPAPLTVGASS
jgi:peptidoglycan/LPS O-acetylase OafA/YrhL